MHNVHSTHEHSHAYCLQMQQLVYVYAILSELHCMRAQLQCDVIALSTSLSCVRTCVAQEENGFGPRTMLICEQCEREFHIGCLAEHNNISLTAVPEEEWFCSDSCKAVNAVLVAQVLAGPTSITSIPAAGSKPRYTWQVGILLVHHACQAHVCIV